MRRFSSINSIGNASVDMAFVRDPRGADMSNVLERKLSEQLYSKRNCAWPSSEVSRTSYFATDA